MMSDSSVSDRQQLFSALEVRHDLFSFKIDGWSAWRVLRNPVHRMVQGLPLSQPVRSDGVRSLQALQATMKLLWLMLIGDSRELLVKTCRSGLRMQLGERFRDVYFDGLLQRGYSCLKLEEINSPDFGPQAAASLYPSDLDPVVFTFWGRILGSLFPVRADVFCNHVANLLSEAGVISVQPRWLRLRISTVYWQAKLYSILLNRIKPRAVFVSDTGEYALRIACHRGGVRFIELQHGVFNAQHPDAVPLWAKGDAYELLLPDRLACRGSYWVDQLSMTRQGNGPAVPVGNEVIDLARDERSQHVRDGCFRIVLTSQGLDSDRLSQWIDAMIAAAPSNLNWRLAIKLHPIYDAKTHVFDRLCKDEHVSLIEGASRPNVFDLLVDADLHLSIASACHFDAAALGVPSVIIPLAGHEAMIDAVDSIQIYLADSPACVWSIGTVQTAGLESMNRFSTPCFLENMQRLLD